MKKVLFVEMNNSASILNDKILSLGDVKIIDVQQVADKFIIWYSKKENQ